MSKFKIGDLVYNQRWKSINQVDETVILAIVPKRWWHLQQRYVVEFLKDFPTTAKENDLILKVKL